jgi:probable DNA metabolism protein
VVRPPDAILPPARGQQDLFERRERIATDPDRADRVWRRLKRYLGVQRRRKLYEAFLSSHTGIETLIYHLIANAVDAGRNSTGSPDLSACIQIDQLSRKVRLEAHRMKGLTRFTQTSDHGYLALIAPRYDVLPLVRRHFESRYADQNWMIVDTRRRYGLCYDRQRTREIQVDMDTIQAACADPSQDEQLSRRLWQRYYAAVTIAARNNPRLHRNKLPRRYWRYLTEKQPDRPSDRRPQLRR